MEENCYIIVPINFGYNDEVYFDEGYEKPKFAYDDIELAKDKMLELEIEQFKGQNLNYYCYGLDEITNDDVKLNSFLEKEFNLNTENDETEIPESATDEQIKELLTLTTLRFFTLVEIPKIK